MTKAELIKELEKYPDDMELFLVRHFAGDSIYLRVEQVEKGQVNNTTKENYRFIGEYVISLIIENGL